MKNSTCILTLAAIIINSANVNAAEEPPSNFSANDLSIAAGIKFWNNKWNANSFKQSNSGTFVANLDSGSELTPIPVVGIKYKNIGFSASYFTKTDYSLSDGVSNQRASRSEYDLSLSYYLLPSLSIGMGYKQVEWQDVKISGPVLSLSGSAPLAQFISMYGTFGLGFLKTKIDSRSEDYNTNYTLGEFGVAYSLPYTLGPVSNISVTAGYRFQQIVAKDFDYGNKADVTDTTSGPVLGVIARF